VAQVAKEPHGAIPVLTTALKLGVGFKGGRGGIRAPKASARRSFPNKKACNASLPTDPIIRSARDKASICVNEVAPASKGSQSARGNAPPTWNTFPRRLEKLR